MNSLTMTPHGLVFLQGRILASVENQEMIDFGSGCGVLTRGSCHAAPGPHYCGVVSMQPIGPESPSVYWVRRAAVLVIVLLVLFGVIWVFGAVAGGRTTQTPVVEPTVVATESIDPNTVLTPVTTDPIDCVDSAILVEASTDSSTYKVGKEPVLSLSIENTGSVPCLRDVGPKANELEVKSGGYHVWSSDDCSATKKTKIVTLEPGDKVGSTITWNGQLSEPGCPDISAAAKAGRYEVIGRNLNVFGESVPFAMTNKN